MTDTEYLKALKELKILELRNIQSNFKAEQAVYEAQSMALRMDIESINMQLEQSEDK